MVTCGYHDSQTVTVTVTLVPYSPYQSIMPPDPASCTHVFGAWDVADDGCLGCKSGVDTACVEQINIAIMGWGVALMYFCHITYSFHTGSIDVQHIYMQVTDPFILLPTQPIQLYHYIISMFIKHVLVFIWILHSCCPWKSLHKAKLRGQRHAAGDLAHLSSTSSITIP